MFRCRSPSSALITVISANQDHMQSRSKHYTQTKPRLYINYDYVRRNNRSSNVTSFSFKLSFFFYLRSKLKFFPRCIRMKRFRLGCLMKGIFDFLSLLVHDNDGRRNGLIERRVWLYQRHIISFSSFSLFLLPPKNSIWHLCDLKFFMQKKRIIRRCPGESWKINFIKNDFPFFFVSFSLVLWLNTEKSRFFLTCVGNRWDVQTHFHLQTLCGTTTMVQCLWTLGLIMQQGMIVRISLSFVGSLVEWRVGGGGGGVGFDINESPCQHHWMTSTRKSTSKCTASLCLTLQWLCQFPL